MAEGVRAIFERFFSDYGFKKKLIFFMISIIFVPVFLFNTLFASLYVRFYNSKIDDGYRSFHTESYSNLIYKLELYQAILDRTVYNSSIAEAIADINPNRMITAYEASVIVDSEIENITFGSAMEEVHNFSIFPCDTNVKAIGKYMSSICNVEHEQWLAEMGSRSKYIFIENRLGRDLLSLAQVIYHTDSDTKQINPVAVAKMEINLDSIMSNSIKESDSRIGIEIIKDDTLCYEYGNISAPKKEKRLLYIENSLLDENFRIRYIFDRTDQNVITNLIILGFFAGGFIMLVALSVIIIRFSDSINRRVGVILNKIHRIDQGDFDVAASLQGGDEFAAIDRNVAKMAKEINRAINENYVIEAERKRAELRALQMQINPHFMFNTLETINSFAKQAGCAEIGYISRKMAEILRYNIDCTSEYVGIQEEIEHIKSYLDIQRIRYSNKFEVFYDISEEAARCRVLKFILQPVVENVIKHAVQEGEGRYFISVVADVADSVLSINISDDGNGISEKRLEQIRQNLSGKVTDGEKSIGLRNVHMRLRITYGDDYGVTVTSKEFVGTSVVLKFPAEYSEEKREI